MRTEDLELVKLVMYMGLSYNKAGQTIYNIGAQSDYFYIVLEGSVEVWGPNKAKLDLKKQKFSESFKVQTLNRVKTLMASGAIPRQKETVEFELAKAQAHLSDLNEKIAGMSDMALFKILRPGETFGEQSMFDKTARSEHCIAVDTTICAVVGRLGYMRAYSRMLEMETKRITTFLGQVKFM